VPCWSKGCVTAISGLVIVEGIFASVKEDMFLLFVCLSVSNFAQIFQTDLHEILREGWQWLNEQMIKFLVAIWITVWIQGLFSGFVTIGTYGKWYQPTALCDAAGQGMH